MLSATRYETTTRAMDKPGRRRAMASYDEDCPSMATPTASSSSAHPPLVLARPGPSETVRGYSTVSGETLVGGQARMAKRGEPGTIDLKRLVDDLEDQMEDEMKNERHWRRARPKRDSWVYGTWVE